MARKINLYVARPGDTIATIAERHRMTAGALAQANPQASPNSKLASGQLLLAPQETTSDDRERVRAAILPPFEEALKQISAHTAANRHKLVRQVEVKPSGSPDSMTYEGYVSAYLRALLKRAGLLHVSDSEIGYIQGELRRITGSQFGVTGNEAARETQLQGWRNLHRAHPTFALAYSEWAYAIVDAAAREIQRRRRMTAREQELLQKQIQQEQLNVLGDFYKTQANGVINVTNASLVMLAMQPDARHVVQIPKFQMQSEYFSGERGAVAEAGATLGAAALSVPKKELIEGVKATRESMFRQPKTLGSSMLGRGEGVTTKFGKIRYSTRGTQTEQELALYHEKVHQFLTPKLKVLLRRRAEWRIKGYAKSQFLRYVEEALAETYAQLRVNGLKGLPDGIMFPLDNTFYRSRLKVWRERRVSEQSLSAGSRMWCTNYRKPRRTRCGTTKL